MFASDRRNPADGSPGESVRRPNKAVNDKRMFRGIDNGNAGVVALKMQAGWGNVTQEVGKRGKSSVGVGVRREKTDGRLELRARAITALFKCRPALLLRWVSSNVELDGAGGRR